MMNESKKNSSIHWRKWTDSGAVDFSVRAKSMGAKIFNYDPLLGCPFDPSAMRMVESASGFSLGDKVSFRGLNKVGTMIFPTVKGRIIAIGENAKYHNGDSFTAIAVQVGRSVFFKTAKEVQLLRDNQTPTI
jgi:hypothetical protein